MNLTLLRGLADHLGLRLAIAANQRWGDDVDRFLNWCARAPFRKGIVIGFGWTFIAGILYSVFEADASVIDGWYWATVVMPTVGFGDYYPHTILGRWLYEFTWPLGKLSEALVMGALMGAIVKRAVRPHHSTTAELDDDFADLRETVNDKLLAIESYTKDPRVKAALREVHNERQAQPQ